MTRLPLDVLRDEKAPAIALLAVVTAKYGTDRWGQSAEFLRQDIENDYGIKLSDHQTDKIQAAIIVASTEAYESQWEAFETIGHILNNTPDNFGDLTPMEAEEIISAMAHYQLLIEGHEPRVFSDEVNAYAGQVFHNYGCSTAPALFPTAIMPASVPSDMTEKNGALQEIYDAKTKYIKDYCSTLSLS